MSRYNHLKNSQYTIDDFKKSVVGLDRDGVINLDRGTYTWKKEDFEPIPKSIEAVSLIRQKGHKVVIITNQAGIHKGLYTEDDVNSLHHHMLDLFGQAGCPSIDGIYFSVSNVKQDPFAKPNIGMFKKAATDIKNLNWSTGYYVGDKITDLKAAFKVKATPILVRTGHGVETEELLSSRHSYRPIKKQTQVYNNLWDFAQAL